MRGRKNRTPEEIERSKELKRISQRRYYQKNKQALREKGRVSYKTNPEKTNERVKRWEAQNPEKARAIRRRAEIKYEKTRKKRRKARLKMEAEVRRILEMRLEQKKIDDLELSKNERLFRHRQEDIKRELAEYAAKPKWVPRVHQKPDSKTA